jgi:hydroxymethylglutaryl-CoA lyase
MMAEHVEIVEVSPRDGLQNEPVAFSTAQKIELIARAVAAGVRRMEVTSFVNPQRVPQMADAEAVMAGVAGLAGLVPIGLVLNRRGLDRALRAGVREINVVVVASDTFSRRNQGVDTEAGLAAWADIASAAKAAGTRVSAVVAAAFGCPFEGEVPAARVAEVVRRIGAAGPDEVALADTIGVASPADVTERFGDLAVALPGVALRAHFHNTRNTGLANAYAALQSGVRALDASIGGIGGCPFAPAATGNVPTEDLAYMLQRMRCATGLSLPLLLAASDWLQGQLGRAVPAMLGRAGLFPRPALPYP